MVGRIPYIHEISGFILLHLHTPQLGWGGKYKYLFFFSVIIDRKKKFHWEKKSPRYYIESLKCLSINDLSLLIAYDI